MMEMYILCIYIYIYNIHIYIYTVHMQSIFVATWAELVSLQICVPLARMECVGTWLCVAALNDSLI